MYFLSERINAIFFFSASTLVVMSGLNILTSKLSQVREADIDFQIKKLAFSFNNEEGWEEVLFTFDMKTDLTKIYNWNVKQLFFYVTVTFNETKGKKK